MNEVKIGVVGVCGRGRVAKHAHMPEKGSRVVACCDVDRQKLEQAREWYGKDVFVTTDIQELLKQTLDAVMVCSPDWLHEQHAVLALSTGVTTFLEKPMAITTAACDHILAAAAQSGAKLFVGHNMRYMSIIRKMKSLIDDGAIGEVRSVWCRHFISYGGDAYFRDWHSERSRSTGLLLQKGVHDFDVMHWLTGTTCQRVAAFGNLGVYGRCPRRSPDEPGDPTFNIAHWPPLAQSGLSPTIDIEDQTNVIMEMSGGVLGTYLQCHFTPDCCRNYTVIGTEGRLENIGDSPRSPIFLWNTRSDDYRMIGDEVHYGDPAPRGDHGGADPLMIAEFLEFVRDDAVKTVASPEAARMAVAVGYSATQSLRDGGKPIDVPVIC